MTNWSWDDVIWGDQEPFPRPRYAGHSEKRTRKPYNISPEVLRKRKIIQDCADRGLTALQASVELGMTRNAVLGFAYRNDITFRGNKTPRA